MWEKPTVERNPCLKTVVNSSQLSQIMKDLRLAKMVQMDLEAGMKDMALDALKGRRSSEEDKVAKNKGWFSDAMDAICKNDVPKAIIIVADVAWIRQQELDMLRNTASS